MEQIVLDAHAKINLTLDVTGKRDDGYHLLKMVMQSVSLCDTVTLTKTGSPGIALTCSAPHIPCGEGNIAYKAAALFCSRTGISPGVSIHIEKRIPSQAGLGGGSADGAAVLAGMDLLFETGLSEDELCDLGVQIGADVPFCIRGGTLLCEGIGEVLTPVPPMPSCAVLLCKPEVNVSTKEAYGKIDRGELLNRPDNGAMLSALAEGDLRKIGREARNVFECVLDLPVIEEIKAAMKNGGALGACMSGSGSAVFGLFPNRSAAEQCAAALSEKHREVFRCEPASKGVSVVSFR